MSKKSHSRALTKRHKVAIAGVATLGAAALAFSAVPGNAQTTTNEAASSAKVAYSSEQLKGLRSDVTEQLAGVSLQSQAAEAAAKKKAEQARKAKEAASRSAKRAVVKAAAPKSYANNLDGWIKESLDIMKSKGIPGTYNGLHRNIIRESSGNPNAINNWDVNAVNGTPSIGLLQIIKPTFDAYHVSGTPFSQYDPVANIVASANYAADKYGSIDNVNGAY
jgi:hypothetical protein